MTRSDLLLWILLAAGWLLIIGAYCWAFQNPALTPPY